MVVLVDVEDMVLVVVMVTVMVAVMVIASPHGGGDHGALPPSCSNSRSRGGRIES